MTTVLATIGVEETKEYSNVTKAYWLSPTVKRDGSEGKPFKNFVYLNVDIEGITTEDLDSILKGIDPEKSIIKTVTLRNITGDSSWEPQDSKWVGRVFIADGSLPSSPVTRLVEVEGTPNLYDLALGYYAKRNIRYVGGTLLAVKDVPVGRYDEGIASSKYGILGKEEPQALFTEGKYDSFDEMPLSTFLSLHPLSTGEELGLYGDLILERSKARGRKAKEPVVKAPVKAKSSSSTKKKPTVKKKEEVKKVEVVSAPSVEEKKVSVVPEEKEKKGTPKEKSEGKAKASTKKPVTAVGKKKAVASKLFSNKVAF